MNTQTLLTAGLLTILANTPALADGLARQAAKALEQKAAETTYPWDKALAEEEAARTAPPSAPPAAPVAEPLEPTAAEVYYRAARLAGGYTGNQRTDYLGDILRRLEKEKPPQPPVQNSKPLRPPEEPPQGEMKAETAL